jgi:hypothetical protein
MSTIVILHRESRCSVPKYKHNLPNYKLSCVIWGFRREVDDNCLLLGYYLAGSNNSLPNFRYSMLVPSSRVESSVRNYNYTLCNIPEERRCHNISCIITGHFTFFLQRSAYILD